MKRVKSLRKKNRVTVVHEADETLITTPPDVLPVAATAFDVRCKATEKLIARFDAQSFSIQCGWCHQVQFFSKEQLMQAWSQLDQLSKEDADKGIPIYCPNCTKEELTHSEEDTVLPLTD